MDDQMPFDDWSLDARLRALSGPSPRDPLKAVEAVWALVSGFPRDIARERPLMVLQCAIDESIENPVFMVGGYFATTETWAAFTEDWCAELGRSPKIDYVKMSEVANRAGQFDIFGDKERDARLNRFVEIMNKHLGYGFAIGLNEKVYRDFFKGKYAETFNSPYYLLGTLCFKTVWNLQRYRLRNTYKVDFIFDNYNKTQKAEISTFWDDISVRSPRWMRNRMGNSPIWRDEKEWLPLQAADVLVWAARRLAVDGLASAPRASPALSSLLRNLKPPVIEFITDSDLEKFDSLMRPIFSHAATANTGATINAASVASS